MEPLSLVFYSKVSLHKAAVSTEAISSSKSDLALFNLVSVSALLYVCVCVCGLCSVCCSSLLGPHTFDQTVHQLKKTKKNNTKTKQLNSVCLCVFLVCGCLSPQYQKHSHWANLRFSQRRTVIFLCCLMCSRHLSQNESLW